MLGARAVENSFGWDYLTRGAFGHFEPIGFGTMWLLAHLTPLNWTVAVIVLAGQVVLAALICGHCSSSSSGVGGSSCSPTASSASPRSPAGLHVAVRCVIWLPLMIAIGFPLLAPATSSTVAAATRRSPWSVARRRAGQLREDRHLPALSRLLHRGDHARCAARPPVALADLPRAHPPGVARLPRRLRPLPPAL